ncbi:MAG TPA: hypothetical protein VII06_32930 [Chloroflexota bacterium]|jgi:hypothetical protein
MKSLIVSVIAASCALLGVPQIAAAQCEGGPTIAGMYGPNGVYIPTHCAYTNPTTPGQLYPSGAEPIPSTNPAAGGSALPGQPYLSGPAPVNSTDLGPAPSYVATPSLTGGGALPGTVVPGSVVPGSTGTTVAPGVAAGAVGPNVGSVASPDQGNLAYGYSLPAAPPREGAVEAPPADDDSVTVAYPNQ